MRSALAYRPRSRPLQLASPRASIAYLGALVLAAFLLSSPLALAVVVFAGAIAGFTAGVGRAVRLGLAVGATMALLLVLVNGIVTQRGATVVARLGEWPLLGWVDVTAEALAAGAVIGLRAMAVTVVASVYSAAVDPDRVLRALRPLARRSSLTAGLVSRMVPLAIADASRLGEAARLRGPGAAPAGKAQLARRLLAGSLDRSVDVAATLEVRGLSLPRRAGSGGRFGWLLPKRRSLPRSRHDRRFLAFAAVITVAAAGTALLGLDRFEAYPRVEWAGEPALALALAAIMAASLAPLSRRARRPGGTR